MRTIENIGELCKSTTVLLVWVECPKCHSLSMTTTSIAEDILIFGCLMCADIESSDILVMPTITKNIAEAEKATCP